MLYRILTQHPGRLRMPALRGHIMAHGFTGWTEIEARGYWEGNKERSLIIEIDTGNKEHIYHKIDALCVALKKYGDQYCVMLQCVNSSTHYI